LLPGTGGRRDGEEARGAVPALQGGRVGAVHHRPLPAAPSRGQQRAPVDPRARLRPGREVEARGSEAGLSAEATRALDRGRHPAGDFGGGSTGRGFAVMERLGRFVPLSLVVLAALAAAVRLAAAPPAPAIQYVDVTAAARIAFKHTNGAFGK